jgi:3-oxoacyl-[acyl-carrier-protein] synthase-1
MNPVYLSAAGLACPVGLTWPSACAAMRAGISRKSISAYTDNEGREIIASYLRGLIREDASYEARWLFLLTRALRDLMGNSGPRALERLPMFLALPLSSSDRPYAVSQVCDALSRELGMRLSPDLLQIFCDGAPGGYMALHEGRASVQAGRDCIVAAVDSLFSARRLLAMAEKQRLLVEGNSDGLISGEAACAMRLSQERCHALGQVSGIGFGVEPSRLDNETPLRAAGLVSAAQAALDEAGLQLADLDFRLSDAAGESFYFKEQSLLVARLLRARKPEFPLWLPAISLGDTGAAAGLCSLVWAMAAWDRDYAPGPRALACAGNDRGARAAIIIQSVK